MKYQKFDSLSYAILLRHAGQLLNPKHPKYNADAITLQRNSAIRLRIRPGNTLTHEIEERKLARARAELIHESRRKVTAEDSAEVVIRDLYIVSF